jgi:hypothetical protein
MTQATESPTAVGPTQSGARQPGGIQSVCPAVVNGEMYGVTLLPLIPDVDACDCFLFVGRTRLRAR